MKLQISTVLLAVSAANASVNPRHVNVAKRQSSSSSSASSSSVSTVIPSSSSSSAATGSSAISGTSTGTATGTISAATTLVSATWGTGVPALSQIASGMPSGVTQAPTTTYAAGVTPTYYSGEPLPTDFVFNSANWPAQDKVPDTSSSEVQEWMTELDGYDIPDISPTTDGTCGGDPEAAAAASQNGWWTCGGWTRSTDITVCPGKKNYWGISFDDGPGFYSTKIINYLATKNILATFFTVGSRVIERPDVLREEYMAGHEISVHTWSHPHLTTLTNAQIVAELGWTRKAINTVLGVTPTTMRPPFGDIDDRVRAISLAMGMVPIIWTRTSSGFSFDTFDWEIPGGVVNSNQSYAEFQAILGNASTMNDGFVVLQHDLWEQTVDMAVGYTLPAALSHDPAFTLEPIGQCNGIPYTDMYLETNTNTSFPYTNHTDSSDGGVDVNGNGSGDSKSKNGTSSASSSTSSKNAASRQLSSLPLFGSIFLATLLALTVAL
jgi:peptidoglycan/xylan/chitin deacetylase (PgdA/CDA1 family)